jgi:hypothetical protein
MLQVARRLAESFAGTHSREHVEETVTTARHRFDGRPVRDFVPILVERTVRQELRTRRQPVEVETEAVRPESTVDSPPDTAEPPRSETAKDERPESTVDTPTYDTLEHLLDGVAKSYDQPTG